MQFTDLEVENTPPPTINRATDQTKAYDSTDQVVLQWSYTGRVQILYGGPGGGLGGGMCPVVSAQKEKKIPSKVDVKIYCLILKVS